MRKAQSAEGDLKSEGQRALEYYQQAMKLGNRSVELRLNIAALYQMLGQYEQGKELLEELIEEQSEDYRPYMRMALLCAIEQEALPESQRDYGQVVEYYEKATTFYQQAKVDGISDPEMQTLESVMQQIINGGWLS